MFLWVILMMMMVNDGDVHGWRFFFLSEFPSWERVSTFCFSYS